MWRTDTSSFYYKKMADPINQREENQEMRQYMYPIIVECLEEVVTTQSAQYYQAVMWKEKPMLKLWRISKMPLK